MATSPGLRRAFRAIANFLNPAVLLMAGRGWMPIVGVIHHRGRRSGRTYSTPVMLRAREGVIFVPRTLGDHAAWYRNLETAGSAEVTYLGRRLTVDAPALVSFQDDANAFPRYERLLFRVLGIPDFLRLRSGAGPVDTSG
jgi:deazaflavin-dependent oxidoreductase (nitroreductase family)